MNRTIEPEPYYVKDGESIPFLQDYSSRPALIVQGCSFHLGTGVRTVSGKVSDPNDPPIPKNIQGSLDFSHHDYNHAFMVCQGSFNVTIDTLIADIGVLVLPNPDGSYGENSSLKIGKLLNVYFGVLASGQLGFDCQIGTGVQSVYGKTDSPGHLFYANETRWKGLYCRLLNPTVRIKSASAIIKTPGTVCDYVTAKFKGSHGIDYKCDKSSNPYGSFDSYGSSGVIQDNWKHPGCPEHNGLFLSFRNGIGPFGDADGTLLVKGNYDARKAVQTVPSVRWENPNGRFDCAVTGDVWADLGTTTAGLKQLIAARVTV